MTEIVYSSQRTGFEPGRVYQNPRYFEKIQPGATKAIVVGDWPRVVQAYKAAGIEVVEYASPFEAAKAAKDAEPPVENGADVDIPPDWAELPWPDMRRLAEAVSGLPIINREEAEKAIHEALEKRGNKIELGTDSGDQFSDDQLRQIIEQHTGRKPHPAAKRETLIARFDELNAGATG